MPVMATGCRARRSAPAVHAGRRGQSVGRPPTVGDRRYTRTAARWARSRPRGGPRSNRAWRRVRNPRSVLRVTPVHCGASTGASRRNGYSANARPARRRPRRTTVTSSASNLPASTSLRALVRAAHQRWAIEQQYQELKTELGLDHFEAGRTPAGTTMSSSPRSPMRSSNRPPTTASRPRADRPNSARSSKRSLPGSCSSAARATCNGCDKRNSVCGSD